MSTPTQHAVSLEHLVDLACFVAEDVEEITGKPIDLKDMRVTLYNPADNYVRNRIAEIRKPLVAEYTPFQRWLDIMQQDTELEERFVVARYLGKNHIAIQSQQLLEQGEAYIRQLLAHELTHMQDDQRYDMYEVLCAMYSTFVEKQRERFLAYQNRGFFRWMFSGGGFEITQLDHAINRIGGQQRIRRTLEESHAEYVEKKYKQLYCTQENSLPALVQKSHLEKLLLKLSEKLIGLDEIKKKYTDGQSIISFAYDHGHDMGMLYENLPSAEELKNPAQYFERVK